MLIKTLIIDDEEPAREGLSDYVKRIDFLELAGVCRNAIEANSFIQTHPVDLLLLDIQLPELSGIEWIKSINSPPMTIFTTAYREYALDGFDLEAVDFLVKPISFQRFLKACNKAQHYNKIKNIEFLDDAVQTELYFFIKSNGQFVKIEFADVLYIEGLKDYSIIYTTNNKYITLISLKNIEIKLPERSFLRTHRSYIVSIDKIESFESGNIKLSNAKVPVSRDLQESVFDYLLKNKLWKRSGD